MATFTTTDALALWTRESLGSFFFLLVGRERAFLVFQPLPLVVGQNFCVGGEEHTFPSGTFNAITRAVAGGGGAHVTDFTTFNTSCGQVKDSDYGFVNLSSRYQSSLQLEYKRSTDAKAYDELRIQREYKDVSGCDSS